jgi:hypothetical protein
MGLNPSPEEAAERRSALQKLAPLVPKGAREEEILVINPLRGFKEHPIETLH